MSFREDLLKEKNELKDSKRPYETAAFILFALLVFQQVFYWLRSFIRFLDSTVTWFPITNITAAANNQAFILRLINIDNSKWIWVLLGFAAWILYYFLIYVFVWRYCSRRGMAKWTWSLFVAFGPTMILIPSYMFFVLYVFRDYFFRFCKRVVVEFKNYDPSVPFPEEIEETESIKEEVQEVVQEEVIEE